MKTETLKIKITTNEPCLGLSPGNKELLKDFKIPKAPVANADEEIALAESMLDLEKGTCVFPKDDTGIFWWNYQIRGAFKGWIETLIELGDCKLSKWSYKKAVDLFLFVNPRRVYILRSDGTHAIPDGTLQRPLRATTLQGDRIALASSEQLLPPVTWTFEVVVLEGTNSKSKLAAITSDTIRDCLELGKRSGFGHWRGGGFGTFTWEEVK